MSGGRSDPYDATVSSPDETQLASAVAPPAARIAAFVAILVGGLCGGLIGYALVDLQTTGSPSVALGLGVLIGSLSCAGGVAVVVVLVLRAMNEWRTIQHRTPRRHVTRA